MIPAAAGRVFLGVGSNLAPREHLPRALAGLRAFAPVSAVATCYVTAPLGRPEQPPYVNTVFEVATALGPLALRSALRDLEARLGRRRTADRFASREIDLDVVLHGDQVLTAGPLHLPDPDLRTRAFLALPLLELAPGLVLPDTGEPLAEVARRLPAADMTPDLELTRALRAEIRRPVGAPEREK